MKTADQILRDALGILLDKGWVRGTLGREGGPRCAVGALREAGGFGWDRPTPFGENYEQYVLARLRLVEVIGYESIPSWNDKKTRTFADVEAAFREAMSFEAR